MTKAVFLDWYNTLVRFDPPREELQARALAELGYQADQSALRRAYPYADDFMNAENARLALEKRSSQERQEFFARYEALLLQKAGLKVSPEDAPKVYARIRQWSYNFALYEDALPALRALKARGLTVGLISNIRRDMEQLCRDLGVLPYLDFYLTSAEVGAEKPHPPIFLAALARAGVAPAEAVHVGDQYLSDVQGARGVGIRAILLDREDAHPEVADCPRIRSLSEVTQHL